MILCTAALILGQNAASNVLIQSVDRLASCAESCILTSPVMGGESEAADSDLLASFAMTLLRKPCFEEAEGLPASLSMPSSPSGLDCGLGPSASLLVSGIGYDTPAKPLTSESLDTARPAELTQKQAKGPILMAMKGSAAIFDPQPPHGRQRAYKKVELENTGPGTHYI
mmetsp:Transcript_66728/g.159572  ORF Transcript_66728/g.159572 Transcript_66728/m.159572 type:complete len:169 (+) Transcript_66728:838-1344(+)